MTRRTVDTVLLEFEGVIADTAHARRSSLVSVLGEAGMPVSIEEYRDTCAGLPTAEAVRAAVTLRGATVDETGLDLLTLRVDRTFRSHVGKGVTLVEGAREAIERLATHARIGIVSRASRQEVEFVVSLARLDHVFACVIGAEDVAPGKPAAAPYLAALRRIERRRAVPADGVVVSLEDSLSGIRSARAAGVRCVAVGDLPAHVAMEADAIIPSLAGIDVVGLAQLVAREGEEFA